ncbi:MAG: cobalt ECF transporter T component CbiQ [Candidatus Firestonebacteria bacterium]
MKHFYIDKYSNLNSLIHRLDPKIKIVIFISFILFVIFTRPDAFVIFVLYASIIIALILLSKIPLLFVLNRSLVVIPFVLFITIFIPFMENGNLLILWNVFVKAYLSILSMILLISSTKFSELLKALEKLKISKLIIMILSFMYRYIFVIEDELLKMKQAKESRTVNSSKWLQIKPLANMIGVLFVRAYERGENVYFAMSSRGFTGDINTIEKIQLNKRDFYFAITVLGILCLIKVIARKI